jgi:hypothetical protein
MKPEVGMQFKYGSGDRVYTIESIHESTIYTDAGTLAVTKFSTEDEGGRVTLVSPAPPSPSLTIPHGGYWR